jgi:cytochrome c-type biogenesis protein CcmH
VLSVVLVSLAAFVAAGSTTSRGVEDQFVAPCCWRESLATHRSPEADAMRRELRELLQSGKTESEIVSLYVERYGQRILREPRGGLGIWLTVVPIVIAGCGGLFVASYIARARRLDVQTAGPAVAVPDDDNWL